MGREKLVSEMSRRMNSYVVSARYWHLTFASCPSLSLTKHENMHFRFLRHESVLLNRRSVYCQHPLNGWVGLPWLLKGREALRLRHLKCFSNCGQMLSPLFHSSSLSASCIPRSNANWRRGAWNQVFAVLCPSCNVVDAGSTQEIYRKSLKRKCDEVLEETLSVDENEIVGLFRNTYKPGPIDHLQTFWTG